MYAVCLRYARHASEAQDMLQEGFIRVFEKLPQYKGTGSLEGWVRRIVVHTCISAYRKKAFQQERFGLEHLPEHSVDAVVLEELNRSTLLGLVSELPEGYRMVFNLFAIEGYDHSEIASLLGCGESTSRSQLAKARRMLQKRIQQIQPDIHVRASADR
jgi:RNA polymerase sigma factor (sigma-70 family)